MLNAGFPPRCAAANQSLPPSWARLSLGPRDGGLFGSRNGSFEILNRQHHDRQKSAHESEQHEPEHGHPPFKVLGLSTPSVARVGKALGVLRIRFTVADLHHGARRSFQRRARDRGHVDHRADLQRCSGGANPRMVHTTSVPTLAPPHTYSTCPVTKLDSRAAKNSTAFATSAGAPTRPTGICRAIARSRSLPAGTTA
jgi:hypothetical protein